MASQNLLVLSALMVAFLVLVSARDLRRRGTSIETVGPGCRIGKTTHYVCCFECQGCDDAGVKDVYSCHGKRIANEPAVRDENDYWGKREEKDYWGKRDEDDYWGKREEEDYWGRRDARNENELEALEKGFEKRGRGNPCRVKVFEGVHRCCQRSNGCACPNSVVATCM